METFTYLFKSVAILSIFYMVYFLFLRKDTLFQAKRHYLFAGVLASLFLPFLEFSKTIYLEAPLLPAIPLNQFTPANTSITEVSPVQTIDFWEIVLYLYLAGVAILLIRLLIQLYTLIKVIAKRPSEKRGSFRFVKVEDQISPFSFFSYIVYNPLLHSEEELEMILKHEQIHASQWHSLDILLVNIARSFQWINPFSWLYKKSVEENLEFIADHRTVAQIPSKKQYQLALVKASSPRIAPALTTQFYQSFIKKRIIMLNKNTSKRRNIWKVCIVLPLLALFLWSFNVKEVTKYKEVTEVEKEANVNKALFHVNLETSENELNRIENSFSTQFKNAALKIQNRKRDANGQLVAFSFGTKYANESSYSTRFEVNNSSDALKNGYRFHFSGGPVILVEELGESGEHFRITQDKIEFVNPVISISEPQSNTNEKEQTFGKNPLYIINGKQYFQNELPEDAIITSTNGVTAYNKKEGLEKYGNKGKDGVLYFQGEAQFIESDKETSQEENTFIEATPEEVNTFPAQEFRIKITKNTTDAELQKMKKELAREHDIDLSYTVVRNSKKEITSISISYTGDGNNGSYNISEDGPIEDFHFYMSQDGGGVFVSSDSHEHHIESSHGRNAWVYEKEHMLKEKEIAQHHEKIARREHKDAMERHEKMERHERMERHEEIERHEEHLARVNEEHRLMEHAVIIDKNTSDETLKKIKERLRSKGMDFSYSKVKRNSQGEIIRIKIKTDNGKGSESVIYAKTKDGRAIEDIMIEI